LIFNLSDLSRKITDIIKERESVGISKIIYLLKANKNTVKKNLASLVKDELITQHGREKTTKYRIA
jgi:predicted transcriptional regulator